MAYKDKDKQREAIKAATRRYRAKKGDSALSGSKKVSQNAQGLPVLDEVSDTLPVIPSKSVIPVTEQQLVKVAEQQFTEEVAKIFDVPTGSKPKRGKDINMKPFEKIWARNLKSIEALNDKPKPQSHNPMMVGYVPPKN